VAAATYGVLPTCEDVVTSAKTHYWPSSPSWANKPELWQRQCHGNYMCITAL